MAQSFGNVHAALARWHRRLKLAPALWLSPPVIGTGSFFGTGSFSGTGILVMPVNPSWHAVSLPPGEALRKLFPRFPLRPACCLAPSQRSSPQAICTVSSPSSMLSRSLPAKLSVSYFHGFLSVQHAVSLPPSEAVRKLFARFPVCPACCLAPSQRSSPQAISTASCPSRMLSRSLPAKLSASYLHGFLSVQHAVSLPPSEAFRKLFARFPIRPAYCLAPSQRSFPQAICTVSSPSSMLSRSLPAKLSVSYLHGFLSVQLAVSLPPSEALPKLFARFPVRPACCLAPSQRSFPQAICTVSYPSSMLSRSLPAKLSASYFHGFLSVQHAASLPPSEAFRKLFARFPLRPACCLAPSQRSSPQAICTVSCPSSMLCLAPSQRSSPQAICTASCPSSMLSRSLPAKLSASYLHGFLSVQHAVSLPPGAALPNLFPRFPLRPACCLAPSQRNSPQAIFPRFPVRPACCLAPSQRSFPQAICTVSSPSSMLSRSLPAKLSPSYLHGFLSVQHAVSLPPSEAFRKLFARFPLRPACCLAPSQRSSPQAICTVSSPSSMLSPSLPAKLSASYLHLPFLPPFLPSSLPSFSSPSSLLSFLPSSLPSFLPSSFPSFPFSSHLRPTLRIAPSRQSA